MFTPKQESPIMLEDETVHIGTQKSRVYCSLPRKKVSSCGLLDSRRWSVTSTMSKCTARCSLKTAPGRAVLPPGTRGQLWSQAHPALLPSSPPAVDGSGQPKWKVWVGKRREMETKHKKDVQMTRTLVNIPSVWTGGCDQWPWAMDCETLVPSALGQPSFT